MMKFVMMLAHIFSVIPGLSGLGKEMIGSHHLGLAYRSYKAKRYAVAAYHYQKIIDLNISNSTVDIACESLGKLYESGLGVEKNPDKAAELYLCAGTNGDSRAIQAEALRSLNNRYK